MRSIPEVPGVMTAGQVMATAQSIAALQRPDGMIPWFPGGHCDPWNHVEAAMALTAVGLDEQADRAYQWLVDTQLPDGSWFNYYLATGIKDPRLDTNVCAYLATGAWHRYVSTGEIDGLEQLWPAVEAGVDFVLRWQRLDGAIHWSLDSVGIPGGVRPPHRVLVDLPQPPVRHRLRRAPGQERPDWELAAGRLAHALAHQPDAFAPKVEFAMDWYYPVLSGALSGESARRRMAGSWDTFVMEGRGVRCVSTGEWVTAAETAECVLALDALGMDEMALRLLSWVQTLRNEDGSYWTGMVYPEEATYPPLERSSYTAGAMVLAADALSRTTPASGIFRGEGLPSHLDLTEPAPDGPGGAGKKTDGHRAPPAPPDSNRPAVETQRPPTSGPTPVSTDVGRGHRAYRQECGDWAVPPERTCRPSDRQDCILITAKAAPSGSERTANRPGGMSVGGTRVVAPSSVALATAASVSSTPK